MDLRHRNGQAKTSPTAHNVPGPGDAPSAFSPSRAGSAGIADFLRHWWQLLLLAALLLGAVAGKQYHDVRPVAPVYQHYLDYLASHSPRARAYLTQYEQRFGTRNVSARHFQQVCGAMKYRATRDQVDVDAYSGRIGPGCGHVTRIADAVRPVGDELPAR